MAEKKYGSPPGRAPPAIERHVSAHHSGALRHSLPAQTVRIGEVRNHRRLQTPKRDTQRDTQRVTTTYESMWQNVKQSQSLVMIPEMNQQNADNVNFITPFEKKIDPFDINLQHTLTTCDR